MKKKKSQKWIKPRHSVVRALLWPPFYLYSKWKYRIDIHPYREEKGQAYFILFNHQTAFDQFFVSLAFRRHVYYVSSEDLFSKGWLSKLITYLVNPIPFRKSTSDLKGIRTCLRVAREGGNIAMAPEGNRTYSGTTEYIKPTVASMVKACRLPLVLFRIEGGYGAHPRWSDSIRRGRMKAYASRVVTPEEYKDMSDEELFDIIQKELWVDEREDETPFYSKNNAEYLDRAMYYCPFCGLSVFHSKGDLVTCTKCGAQVRYLPNKRLEGVNKPFPYPYVKEWYDAQSNHIHALDLSPYMDTPLYRDTVKYSENIYCKNKIILCEQAELAVYGDRFEVKTDDKTDVYPFSTLSSATVLGKNKLNIYWDERIFQFKGDKHFNALKYLNLYYHAVNTTTEKENADGRFLGL